MKTVAVANLILGDKFSVKAGGRKYEVLDSAKSDKENVIYIIAESQGIKYAFESTKEVLVKTNKKNNFYV